METQPNNNQNRTGTENTPDALAILERQLSRDPSDYVPTDHFLIRAKRDFGPRGETRVCPPITPKVTRTCIAEGTVESACAGHVKFVAMVDEIEWHMVVHIDGADRELEQLHLLEEGKGLDLDGEPIEDVGGVDDVKGRVLTAYAPAHHTRIDVGKEVSDR